MTMQRLCHAHGTKVVAASILIGSGIAWTQTAAGEPAMHDYPTTARVEYVSECLNQSRGSLASLYQCSCVIDRIATSLTYDEYVEASTFARYSSLAGEAGGVFRDSDRAKALARMFRDTEATARAQCGLPKKG